MSMILPSLWLSLCCALLVSCASEQKVSYGKTKLDGLRKFESDVEFATNEDGGAVWKNGKRSQFESQSGFNASTQYKGKSYVKNDFNKESWSQNKSFRQQSYQGNTDGSKYQRSPYFANKSTAEQGQLARSGGKKYVSSNYAAADKQVGRGRQLARPLDAETNVRRRVYVAPPIQVSEGYNGLSVDDANSLLGR